MFKKTGALSFEPWYKKKLLFLYYLQYKLLKMTTGPSVNEPIKLNAVNVITKVLTGEISFFFRRNMTMSVAFTTMLHVNKIMQ